MIAAIKKVEEGLGLREASRQCNVPVETLRRRVVGAVGVDCKPGPPTVLTAEEEQKLVDEMSEMGFGLTRQDVMRIAFPIASKSGRPHPFQNGAAGRSWFESFRCRHQNLTLRSAQPLSFARAAAGNKEVIGDFFGAIYARLNLFAKPMQIFNVDETGISVVHKTGKVTELGRRNVWGVTSAEKGCVSASGFSLPPMLIYPRKRLAERLKNGALPGTLFGCSDNGWINQALYLEWFKFFVASIPPARPVLLIEDGHSSHVSLEVIRLARENQIHLLCLPAHTTHLLQPLDVGVFKSLKSNFSKVCRQFLAVNPGQAITTDLISSLLAKAWPLSVTPVNVMSGFKKCGIYPLNPGEISDRQLAPSRVIVHSESDPQLYTSQFTPEQITLFQTRYEEGFDLEDSEYKKWLQIYHPEDGGSVVSESSHGVSTSPSNPSLKTYAPGSSSSLPSSSSTPADSLSEIFVLPKPKPCKPKRQGLNTRAVVITDDSVLKDIEKKQEDRRLRDEQRERKRIEREKRKEQAARKKKQQQVRRKNQKQERKSTRLEQRTQKGKVWDEPDTSNSDSESDAECKKCGLTYRSDSDGSTWICCDFCNSWYHKFWCVLMFYLMKYLIDLYVWNVCS